MSLVDYVAVKPTIQTERLCIRPMSVNDIPSQKMLEKCGYTREGLIRQGKMVNTWCDYYIYGILVSDYSK